MKKLMTKKCLFALSLTAMCLSSLVHATEKKCAFGNELNSLASNAHFVAGGNKMGTFKMARIPKAEPQLLWVYITQYTDTTTKKVYQVNATNDDAYDGGNTIGWIEEVTNASEGVENVKPSRLMGPGAVVAIISDSQISCIQDIE